MHEDPNTIEDGVFRLDNVIPPYTVMENSPAALHNQSSSFSFADGHADFHRWTLLSINNGVTVVQATANITDATWIKKHAFE